MKYPQFCTRKDAVSIESPGSSLGTSPEGSPKKEKKIAWISGDPLLFNTGNNGPWSEYISDK